MEYDPAMDFSQPMNVPGKVDDKITVPDDVLEKIINGDTEPAIKLEGGIPATAARTLQAVYTNDPTGGALGQPDPMPITSRESALKIKEIVGDVVDAVLPDALVVGVTGPRGRTFGLESFATGDKTSFNALGLNAPGQSVVGKVALDSEGNINSELGFCYAKKIKIPALANTEGLVFVNVRSDSLPSDLEWKSDGSNGMIPDVKEGETVTVSVNFGGAYSISDAAAAAIGAAAGAAMILPVPGPGARLGAEAANAPGYDAWAGVAWRATATFNSEGLASVKIGDTEIPVDQIGDFVGDMMGKSANRINDELETN